MAIEMLWPFAIQDIPEIKFTDFYFERNKFSTLHYLSKDDWNKLQTFEEPLRFGVEQRKSELGSCTY